MNDSLQLFLIEDEDDVAFVIRKTLERSGHQVTPCRTAADALIVLGHSSFDLVLLDNHLPDMKGLDLLAALGRDGISAPTVIMTAYGDEELVARVFQAGALDYIVKDPQMRFLAELPKRVRESVTRHQLLQRNRLLIEALESARDGIMITDLQGNILQVNQALEDMTGYTRQELVGQNPRILKSGVHPQEVYAEMWRRALSRTAWQGELTNRRKDGTLIEVSLTVSPIVSQGQLTHLVGIQRDMSERKHLERQLLQAQKMQSVGTLAGGVAHEFNNLLAGINGYASLGLREPGINGQVREFLQYIVDLSERAASLTRQLLAFARKPALSRRPTPMAELARNTAELVTRTLHADVALDIQESSVEGGLLFVEADANQLQQALVNLALNARDATHGVGSPSASGVRRRSAMRPANNGNEAPPHPPEPPAAPITFRLRRALLTSQRPAFPQNIPPGDYALLEVADRGHGMKPEVLTQSLDPFFTTKEVGQGTGLGLPMVFGIVQGHQGFLAIDSSPERGTRVGIYLPRLTTLDGKEQEPGFETGQVLEPEQVENRAILVVDDEQAVQDVVRRFLEIAGHRVTCASSGAAALEMLAVGTRFDLVVLDLMMPREDPAANIARIRHRLPDVPILICTGLPQADPAPQLLTLPHVSLLRKPFRMNELWYAVKQALHDVPVKS
jgi:PAS domain S-box-containing protein